jgi:hypothetical protein
LTIIDSTGTKKSKPVQKQVSIDVELIDCSGRDEYDEIWNIHYLNDIDAIEWGKWYRRLHVMHMAL